MCMIDDAERVRLLNSKEQTARVEHRCSECRRGIAPSERYLREAYVFDRELHAHKTCAHCRVVRDWLSAECGGWAYGCLEEDLRDHCDYARYPMSVYRMAVGMAWRWRTPSGRMLPVPQLPSENEEAQR